MLWGGGIIKTLYVHGHDPRSQACAEELARLGYSFSDLPEDADYILLPMNPVPTPQLFCRLKPWQTVIGGNLLSSEKFRSIDLMHDSLFTARNAIITAEGAVSILMEQLDTTIRGATILVLGFGRIGTALSHGLKLLGAEVTVSCRREADEAKLLGLGMEPVRQIPSLARFDAVVNTVPSPVIPREAYEALNRNCVVLELASAPGGLDEGVCRALSVRYIRAPGLPGRYAPKTAGIVMAEAIARILSQEENHAT